MNWFKYMIPVPENPQRIKNDLYSPIDQWSDTTWESNTQLYQMNYNET